jgi:antitoxin component of MazEF toxin-antitoxin module
MAQAQEYESERKVIKISDSLGITLPQIWVRARGLKPGDKIKAVFNSHDYLKIVPVAADEEKKEGEETK